MKWFYFEAQCGKTILDTHFSFVGLAIIRFARTVRPVRCTLDLFDSLCSEGGIANSNVILLNVERREEQDLKETFKVDGIQKLHEVQFFDDHARTYDQTNAEQYNRIELQAVGARAFRIENRFESPKRIWSGERAPSTPSDDHLIKVIAADEQTQTERRIIESLKQYVTGSESSNLQITRMLQILPATDDGFQLDCFEPQIQSGKKKKRDEYRSARTRLQGFVPNFGWHWTDKLQRERPEIPSGCDLELRKMVGCSIFRLSFC
jgi:hypothetical protein